MNFETKKPKKVQRPQNTFCWPKRTLIGPHRALIGPYGPYRALGPIFRPIFRPGI